MTTTSAQIAASFVVLSASLALPRVATADITACVQAHAAGQREANAGQLRAASESFASCVSEAGCPDTIRAECAEFYKNTERNIPTLIFAVVDEHGRDLSRVRVSIDDRVLTETLDGRPLAIDPGEHHFQFNLPSGELVESELVVRQGEKNRILNVRAKPDSKPAEQASAEREGAGDRRQLPPSFWVASSVGAAALVSFGAFALVGHAKQTTLNDCSPSCSSNLRADYDGMRRDYLIADVSLGVAVASAGVATWLFFRHDRRAAAEQHPANSPSALSLTPLVSTRGAGLVLGVRAF